MRQDDIIKLIDAGFTKSEIQILGFLDGSRADPAEPEATPAEPAAEPEAAPAQTAEPAQNQTAGQDQILEALNRLTNTIIKSNINSTVIQPAERTPEEALAEIIAPPRKNKEAK